jgi:hypothetical protein
MGQIQFILAVIQLSLWVPYYLLKCDRGESFLVVDLARHQQLVVVNVALTVGVTTFALAKLVRLLSLQHRSRVRLRDREKMCSQTVFVNHRHQVRSV